MSGPWAPADPPVQYGDYRDGISNGISSEDAPGPPLDVGYDDAAPSYQGLDPTGAPAQPDMRASMGSFRAYDQRGDGQSDMLYADTTGNGNVDTERFDYTGDGNYDTVLQDTTGDGRADTVLRDTTGDGKYDAVDYNPGGQIMDPYNKMIYGDMRMGIAPMDMRNAMQMRRKENSVCGPDSGCGQFCSASPCHMRKSRRMAGWFAMTFVAFGTMFGLSFWMFVKQKVSYKPVMDWGVGTCHD